MPAAGSAAPDERTGEHDARVVRTLLMLVAVLAIAATLVGAAVTEVPPARIATGTSMAIVAMGGLATLRAGGPALALGLFLYGCLALILADALLLGGIRAPSLLALSALPAITGWFMGRRAALLVAFYAAVGAGLIAWLEHAGRIMPQPSGAAAHLLTLAVMLPVSAFVGVHAHRRFLRQLRIARENARRIREELENRQQVQRDLQARNSELQLVHQLSARVQSIRDVEAIMRVAIDTIVEVAGAEQVTTYLVTADGSDMKLVASHGFDAAFDRTAARFTLQGSWSELAFRKGRPLVAGDLGAERSYTPAIREALTVRGLKGAVLLPLTEQGAPLGCVALFYRAGVVERFGPDRTASLEAVARTLSMAIASVRHLQHLLYRARHDALTGLPNRIVLHESFEALADRLRAGARPAVMLLDLDRFKEINDTLGHEVGDDLLSAIAQRLERVAGHEDALTCRLGGDEFAVLLRDTDSADAALARARRICDALERPFDIGGMSLKIGASLGLALHPEHGANSHQLLRAADVAMYRAKRHGLGVSLYDRRTDTHSADKLLLLAELSEALDEGQLVLHFQPEKELRTGRIVGVEALVRWRHPKRGFLAPGEFVPLVEASELIHPFTRAVLGMAMQACRRLRREGFACQMALNLSARNLVDDRCVQDIERQLRAHDLPGEAIVVELTETAIMHDTAQVAGLLDRLDRQGVGLALDDFGTGFSSLANLKRLPLDFLKVDGSFVRDMTTDEQDAIIVRSTITLAHNLGKKVIAEGVEDAAAERLLREMGCDIVQGYHLARPMPLDELIAWIRRHEATRLSPEPLLLRS